MSPFIRVLPSLLLLPEIGFSRSLVRMCPSLLHLLCTRLVVVQLVLQVDSDRVVALVDSTRFIIVFMIGALGRTGSKARERALPLLALRQAPALLLVS